MRKEFKFAEKYVDQPSTWPSVIFSDDAFLFPYKSGKLFIRRYPGEKAIPFYEMYDRWDPRTVKVWGCIGVNGVGPLVRFEDTIDNTTYLEILEGYLLKAFPKLRGTSSRPGALIFQDDNAKPHRTVNLINWFKAHHVQTLNWPSWSPDLNPIENLWGIIQDRLYNNNQ